MKNRLHYFFKSNCFTFIINSNIDYFSIFFFYINNIVINIFESYCLIKQKQYFKYQKESIFDPQFADL